MERFFRGLEGGEGLEGLEDYKRKRSQEQFLTPNY